MMTLCSKARGWLCILSLWLGALAPLSRAADEFFINSGVLQATFPPEPLPMIDARRVVNLGILGLTNNLLPGPIEFQNALYYTNRNQWRVSPGFRFDTFDPSRNPQRRMAAVFHNEGLLHPNAAEVATDFWLLVQATNIINRGRLEIGPYGQINLTGDALDLRGGELRFQGTYEAAYDIHWGIGTNMIVSRFSETPLVSPTHQVQGYAGAFLTQVVLPPGYASHVRINQFAPGLLVEAVYVYNGCCGLDTEVRIHPLTGVRYIRWRHVSIDPITHLAVTNELYLTDTLTPSSYNFSLTGGTLLTPSVNPLGAFRPFNFSLTTVQPPGFATADVIDPGVFDPAVYTMGTSLFVAATNAGYRGLVPSAVVIPTETEVGSAFSNVMGRLELVARGALDLRDARIVAPSFLLLQATNHFVGASNASISAPYSIIRLGSTNGLLEVRQLQVPRLPKLVGDVRAWSGLWTNITPQGVPIEYRVLIVSNYFQPDPEPMIQDLELRSPRPPHEVRVADKLNVFRSALIEAERLTLTTNEPPGRIVPPWLVPPYHPVGELNLLSNTVAWAESFPRLRYLTNHGNITISNAASWIGLRRPPWYPGTTQEPYEAVINQGRVDAQSLEIWSRHLENDGQFLSLYGPLRIRADRMRLGSTDSNLWGRVETLLGDVELVAGELLVTNQMVLAGRRLVLAGTNYLGDAETTNNVFVARDGLTLMTRPAAGDLRGTTITNLAAAYAQNVTVWAGEDRGPDPQGFTNNVAIGRLVLDGQYASVFRFQGPGLSNALYVDQLILLNHATNELNNAFAALEIAPNFVIYYADLWVAGQRLAEPVDSSRYNQGRLRWVPAYAGGFYGSTNLPGPGGQIRINTALRESRERDSDGDGLENFWDPIPIVIPDAVTPADVPLTARWESGTSSTVVLTWPSAAGAVNTVYESDALSGQNWRILLRTNFATLPLPPEVPCWDPACWTNVLPGRAAVRLSVGSQGPRFYRVEVELPRR
ncbi:MAG: hypothetical protein WHT82_09395 [Limisphaera sp.]